MAKLTENDLIELAQIYNTSGRPAMVKILKEKYQVKNTYNVLKRMEKRGLTNPEIKSDEKSVDVDNVFMSMDELCSPVVTRHTRPHELSTETRSKAMERMIQELIGDRLLELGKYISLNTSDRIVIIDKTTLMADGYQMVVH